MEKPILILQKNADKEKNRVILPKEFIKKYGNSLYMEVYQDKLIIKPMTHKLFEEEGK